ncbi:MAG TPA: hypothetical protein VHD14_12205 [Pseudolabrys sp.]|nr:hypothetical protein [Pseudolabrys sp.]
MQVSRIALASIAASAFFASSVASAAPRGGTPAPRRIVVPISQRVLSDGQIRYSIPVSVGGSQPIAAMLDTGSTGMRILAGTVNRSAFVSITATPSVSHFNSGVRLNGVVATARVRIGQLAGAQPFALQLVRSVDCIPSRPQCPASRISAKDYRIGGDGLPKEGYNVIVGVAMGTAAVDNPLRKIAAQSWIVELPLPGASNPGRLILNPDTQDIAGYTIFPTHRILFHVTTGAAFQDAIPTCLNDATSHIQVCGPALLDTGAPGITVNAAHPQAVHVSKGDHVALAFTDKNGNWLKAHFTADAGRPSHVTVTGGRTPPLPRMSAGSLPFFFFDVLYDDQKKMVGLKAR